MSPDSRHRLPRSAAPVRYELCLEPRLDDLTFLGTAAIDVVLSEPSVQLTLNAAELEIDAAEIEQAGRRISLMAHLDPSVERLTLVAPEEIAAGDARLHLQFRGELNDQLRGFYRSTWRDDDGGTHVIATTQFEATHARRAFPCWDEPDRKATFGVSLVVPDALAAISCEPVVAEEHLGDGRRKVTFADTMALSPYLVAFVVGELEATAPVDVAGVPLRVVHRPGRGHLTGFAMDAGAHALAWLTDYYGIAYPGGKIDMIAVPDFSDGAMENLGAIVFRERDLLIDPVRATQAERARVATTVAHEVAHMWFGNLVTMRWWNGTWLKEAFATFMELKCTDAFRPEWKVWLDAGVERDGALEVDALEATRPIEYAVGSPEEANSMFDTLTYDKGSAVLRMLEQFLGEETFRRGVADYLETHAYGNTEAADLWAALEQASGEPVGLLADRWITMGGHPEVSVEAAAGGRRLSQRRFRYQGSDERRWMVPVVYRDDTGVGRVVVDEPVVVAAGDGFVANARGSGFFRTRYDGPLLGEVLDRIDRLDPLERFGLVTDTWAGLLADRMPLEGYVDVVSRLRGETEPVVWSGALTGLGELDRIAEADARPALQAFVRRLVGPALAELGWEPGGGEDELTRQRRGVLIRAMGHLGADSATIASARELFAHLGGDEPVDAEVVGASLTVVAATGDAATWQRLVDLWRAAATAQDETRYLRAACIVPDADCAAALFDMVLSGVIRRQDAHTAVANLLGARVTGPGTWTLMRQHWDEVRGAVPEHLERRLFDLVHLRSEPGVASDIETWLAHHPIRGNPLKLAQILERLRIRVALREREALGLATAFG
jgi:puromycin-sensitive aminopeptidase